MRRRKGAKQSRGQAVRHNHQMRTTGSGKGRPFRPGLLLALAICAGMAAGPAMRAAQLPAATRPRASAASAFEPLERWKAAVVAGDWGALAALYTSLPGSFAQTPQGRTADPNEEPEFWAGLRARGLESFNPKILQMSTTQPGVTVLTLRIEFTLRGTSGPQNVLVSGAQVWVEQGTDWRIYRSQRTDVLLRQSLRLPEPARPNPQLYPDPSEAQRDVDAALAASRADHKRVLVVFGGNWCYDCHVLDAAFHSKAIRPLVEANYHVVHVNIGEYNSNLDIAQRCQVVLDKGVPALAVLDGNGHVVTSQKQGEFESAVKIGPADVTQFLERWKPGAGR